MIKITEQQEMLLDEVLQRCNFDTDTILKQWLKRDMWHKNYEPIRQFTTDQFLELIKGKYKVISLNTQVLDYIDNSAGREYILGFLSNFNVTTDEFCDFVARRYEDEQ